METEKWTEITISQFKKGLETKRNMLVFGQSGYGKSATVYEYAKENKLTVIEINFAMELPENIGGIPYKTKDGYFEKLMDARLEPLFKDKGKGYLLLLEEFNQASPEIMNASYGFTHPDPKMRNWAGHNIGECQVVALGNLNDGTDGTVYLTDLPTPLLNRFFCFRLKPDSKSATEYLKAKYKNIPQVTKYIREMLNNKIAPRDIDLALEILQYNMDSMFLEAKLGTALTAKLYEMQKNIKSADPAELLKNAKVVYSQFKEDGAIIWAGETVTDEKDLISKFEEMGLNKEEITAVMKGDE